MVVGQNNFAYSDQSTGERKVRITHEWVERSASKPPLAPPAAIYPRRWRQGRWHRRHLSLGGPFGPRRRQDCRLPLRALEPARHAVAAVDELLQADLADGRPRQGPIHAARPGLLTPDRQYYWHVRAKDDKGVWGPWSKTWSFTAQGPAYPLEVTLSYDQGRIGTLRWKPNPVGRQPAKYRVYGSDEKGFSVSDVPYKVNVGASKELPSPFPANFIAETPGTELDGDRQPGRFAQCHEDLLSRRGG